jgi:hypothetical protein
VTTGTPPGTVSPRRRRDWLPFVIAGVVLAVLAVIGCLAGALVVVERQKEPPPPIISPSPVPRVPSPAPSSGPTGDNSGGPPGSAARFQ